MPDQKLENLLNLALQTSREERERSWDLETGYDEQTREWELIVRYAGSLDAVRSLGASVEELLGGYAILTVPETLVEAVSELPQILFVEKPKRLWFAASRARAASCINIVQENPLHLSGRGVLVAVLDSGIDYFHEDFRDADGRTRIALLWDQARDQVYTADEINEALAAGSRVRARERLPQTDASGHGTAVAGIAAGNGRENGGTWRGVAYESSLIVVCLGTARADGFPRTTELMRAVNFAVLEAVRLGMPLVINISFGNNYGSHDGTSLLETFLDSAAGYGRTTTVVGSGNEGASQGHCSGMLSPSPGAENAVELSIAPYETGISIQLWKSYVDRFALRLRLPSGEMIGPLPERLGVQRYRFGDTAILVYYGKPGPYSQAQEIYFDFVPDAGTYVESGIWTFLLSAERVIEGRYDFWLPGASVINPATRFLAATPDTTLTIPSAAPAVITVGAYDSAHDAYAAFSGRGFTRLTDQIKPDIAAPGVGLTAPAVGGGYSVVTGTSFATPVVAGSAALMMQWGIVEGNDPYLYGEKIKACLRRGARQLPGYAGWPNPQLGFGALCLRDSFPETG
ncbi:MAG: S8 family serine peptidase [Clostridiales bacterium]|nr:S8 family serine peptidase [Clostridiales bacterium]